MRIERPRMQKSRYDGDAWITVQAKKELLLIQNLGGGLYAGYAQARTDLATSAGVDVTFLDQNEYQQVGINRYQHAEVRGIKAEVTAAPFSDANAKALDII